MSAMIPELPIAPIEGGEHHDPTLLRRFGLAITHFFNAPLSEKQLAHRTSRINIEAEVESRLAAGQVPDMFPMTFSDIHNKTP